MEKRLRMFLVLLGLPLIVITTVNCGISSASVCSQLISTLKAKVGDCGPAPTDADQTKCTESMAKCTPEDLVLINTGVSCLGSSKVSTCQKAKVLDWLGEVGTCAESFKGASKECEAAVQAALQTN